MISKNNSATPRMRKISIGRKLHCALRLCMALALAMGGSLLTCAAPQKGPRSHKDPGSRTMESVRVRVYNGERVSTFFKRVVKDGVVAEQALRHVVGHDAFGDYGFVPSVRHGQRRFEGLFVPGEHTLTVPRRKTGPRAPRVVQVERARARALVLALLQQTQRRNVRLLGVPTGRATHRPRLTLYQSMILASLVEKEAAAPRHYERIAGVFLARLRRNVRLTSCPSVEYFLGYHRPFLLYKDLFKKSPYNTYLHRGLPPTPISFFSAAALRSVLHPKPTRYFFFVRDWALGEIYFAASYRQHQRNIKRSLRNFRRKFPGQSLHTKTDKFYEH